MQFKNTFFSIIYKANLFLIQVLCKIGCFFFFDKSGRLYYFNTKGSLSAFLEALHFEYHYFHTPIVGTRTRIRSNSRFYNSQVWILRNNCISFRACCVVFADTFAGSGWLFFCDVGVFSIGNFEIVLGVDFWVFFWVQ